MTDIPLPAFDRPPVGEVVFGVGFDPIPNFRLPHLGLYWATVKEDYPHCSHAQPLGPFEHIIDPETGLPVPRVWLIHKDDDRLIQIQSNWYYFNWRRMSAAQEYPHYEHIKLLFMERLIHFYNFLSHEGLDQPEPKECELTYINSIPKGQGWETIADMENIMPDLRWRDRNERFLPEPHKILWHTSINLPEDTGVLNIKFQSATQKTSGEPTFRLEMSARGIGKDHSFDGVGVWLELAHEWIIRGFADITGREVQLEHWRRTDVRP